MRTVIKKGKLLKGDVVEIDYTKQVGENKPAACSETHTETPKKELKDAMAALAIHAALMGEFIHPALVENIADYNPELVKDYTVTGFTIVGKDDSEGVILSAHKTLKSGKTLGFNTPVCSFDAEGPNAYPFVDNLIVCVDECIKQFTAYLNGEFAANPQGAIEFPEQQ